MKQKQPRVVREVCPYQHTWVGGGGMGPFNVEAHNCPARALQRVVKARGYRAEFNDGLITIFTTKKQFVRLFAKAEERAVAKYNKWLLINMPEQFIRSYQSRPRYVRWAS